MCVKTRKRYATGIRLERSPVMLVGKKKSHLNRNLCVHIRHAKPLVRTGIWFIRFVKIL